MEDYKIMEKIRESLFIKQFCNEATRPEMIRLVRKYGGDGYMVYRLLLAYLWDNGLYIVPENISFISSGSLLMKDEDKAVEIVNYCLEIHLLETSTDGETKGMIFSPELMEAKDVMDSKHEKAVEDGRKGGKETARRRKAKETQAPLKPPSSPPQANKKERKTKKKNESETETQTQTQNAEATAMATAAPATAAKSNNELFLDFPQDTKKLCDEICDKFGKKHAYLVYCPRIDELLKAVTPENQSREYGFDIIREGLAKLDEAMAIKLGVISFNINSFLNPDMFLSLYSGSYKDVY